MAGSKASLKVPKLPKDFPVNLEFKQLIEAFVERGGIPLEAAQALYDEGFRIAVKQHADEQVKIEQTTKQNTEFNESILRSRWGDDFEKKMASVDALISDLNLSDEMLKQMLNAGHAPVNLIEQFAQAAERLAALKSEAPETRGSPTSDGKPGATKVENPAQLLKTLERQMAEWRNDPKWLESFTNQRNPMHPYAVEEWHATLDRIAALKAVARGETSQVGRGSPQAAAAARAELSELEDDPEFMAELKDASHFRHTERKRQRDNLIKRITTAELATAKPARSAATVRRELEEFLHNPEAMRTIGMDPRKREHSEEYRTAIARHEGLVSELIAAEQNEGVGKTLATAAGANPSETSNTDD